MDDQKELEEIKAGLRELNFSYEDLLHLVAGMMIDSGAQEQERLELIRILEGHQLVLHTLKLSTDDQHHRTGNAALELLAERNPLAKAIVKRAQFNRTHFARMAANARLQNDAKQKDKTFVHRCWQDWQRKPESYPSKAAFARDMLEKCENLTSQKKIEDWCREWEKANSAG